MASACRGGTFCEKLGGGKGVERGEEEPHVEVFSVSSLIMIDRIFLGMGHLQVADGRQLGL